MSFGEYCAMYLAVWSNAVWELKADGKPALATIDEVYTLPDRRRCRSSGSCTRASSRPRTRSRASDAPSRSTTRSRSCARTRRSEGLRARDRARSTRLLRLAAARAPRARERPDLHGLRRPRRDRRLEPRPRVARPRVHRAARPADPHQRARRLRRLPGLGQRPAALPQGAVPDAARPRARSTSRCRGRTRPDDDPDEATPSAAREAVRPQPARPRGACAAAQVALLDRRAAPPRASCSTRAPAARFRSRYLPPGLLSAKALEEQLPDPARAAAAAPASRCSSSSRRRRRCCRRSRPR